MAERRAIRGKPLLVATVGLASVTLTGCFTSGNLMVDAGRDTGHDAQAEDAPEDAPGEDAVDDAD